MNRTFTRLSLLMLPCAIALSSGCDYIDQETLEDLTESKGDQAKRPPMPPSGAIGDKFVLRNFEHHWDEEACKGAHYMRFDREQGLYVGVVACSPTEKRSGWLRAGGGYGGARAGPLPTRESEVQHHERG